MIYRLKAPTRKDIEDQIQVAYSIYVTGENGKTIERFATEDYSYHYIGKEVLEKGEYNEEGEMIKSPTLSSYVLADLQIYKDTEINFKEPVEVLNNINTPMHGWI